MLTRLPDEQDEREELLDAIAAQIEQRARLESEPDLADLRKGLEILRRELARQRLN